MSKLVLGITGSFCNKKKTCGFHADIYNNVLSAHFRDEHLRADTFSAKQQR